MELADLLERTSNPSDPVAAGAAAAVTVATSACLAAMAARRSYSGWPEGPAMAGQAEVIRSRAEELLEGTVEAYATAAARLSGPRPEGQVQEENDWALGVAVTKAGAVPMAIAETAADLADLASQIWEGCGDDARPDARSAAILAEAAVAVCAALVEANLTVVPGDPRLDNARALERRAQEASERCRRPSA